MTGIAGVGLPDADVRYRAGFFAAGDADRLLAEVLATTPWRQEHLTLYGRRMPVPRLTAWHGDPGCTYTYSRITMHPEPWTPALAEVKARVDDEAGVVFNSVLVNLYRDGRDSNGWHSDDEPELGPAPVIASVSLGATRLLKFRRRDGSDSASFDLAHGSVMIMRGPTQQHWRHQVPKTSRPVGPRVNLTFRIVATR